MLNLLSVDPLYHLINIDDDTDDSPAFCFDFFPAERNLGFFDYCISCTLTGATINY